MNKPQHSETNKKPAFNRMSLIDILQSDVLLKEFHNILNIKRGKQLQALKVDKIYERVHLIEEIVDRSCNSGEVLKLEQL